MALVDDLIKTSKYKHELFQEVRKQIVWPKWRDGEHLDAFLLRITEGERHVTLITFFIWEVTNGGLDQFLTNSSGDYGEETFAALTKIAAVQAADALATIRKTVFGGNPIPKNRETRCDILFAFEEEHPQRYDSLIETLSRALGWCESVECAIADYIVAHPEMFRD